jgi:tryptophan halogenase
MVQAVQRVIVLGGGSAGFMAAAALKTRLPQIDVHVIRSPDIGIIGVGEGSTVALSVFLHDFLNVGRKKFIEVARPSFKLGLRFIWGPRPEGFFYSFGAGADARVEGLAKPIGYYCDDSMDDCELLTALMARDKAFPRAGVSPAAGGGPGPGDPELRAPHAYHFENEHFVTFLEGCARALGVTIAEDTVAHVRQDERGVAALDMASGRTETADLYVDCSGFVSLLLGKTLGEPFVSYANTLFCDRAVAGGWDRTDEPIHPYTTCETMDAGWCWQIEHERRINRGYVYASAFITDDAAEREFRRKNPKVGPTRIVKFVSGRYERRWVKNVVAVGNSAGFVEPLEATALGVIGTQSTLVAEALADADGLILPTQVAALNRHHARLWDAIRDFLSVHYRFNTRLDTPFWQHCRAHADLAGAATAVDYFRENGPSRLWASTVLDALDPHQLTGYATLLTGQRVPFRRAHEPDDRERRAWDAHRRRTAEAAARGLTVRETLETVRSPRWRWVN